jgi:hypothetical protein
MNILKALLGSGTSNDEATSRRKFLSGLLAVGAVAVAAPYFGTTQSADASMTPRLDLDLDPAGDADVLDAQYSQNSRRRWRRRELERRCRRDRRFRRENRRLCARATGRDFGRPGSCVRIGPVEICE